MQREQQQEKLCACGNRAVILCLYCQDYLCDLCYDLGEGCCALCGPAILYKQTAMTPSPDLSAWLAEGDKVDIT